MGEAADAAQGRSRMRRPLSITTAAILVITGTFVLVTGCKGILTRPSLDATFHLSPGESRVVPDARIAIAFPPGRSDSRCPADVVCAWAGEATVSMWARDVGSSTRSDFNVAVHALTD